jgi:hypothetical protein
MKRAIWLMSCLLLFGCATKPAPVKVDIVKVPVEVTIPIPARLTQTVPAPSRPANRCKDDRGRATLCNRDLAGWLNAFDLALSKANDQLRAILGLQPKP